MDACRGQCWASYFKKLRITVTSYSHQKITSYLISYFLKIVTSYLLVTIKSNALLF